MYTILQPGLCVNRAQRLIPTPPHHLSGVLQSLSRLFMMFLCSWFYTGTPHPTPKENTKHKARSLSEWCRQYRMASAQESSSLQC